MRVIVINGAEQTLESAEVGREQDMRELIGQDSVIYDEIDDDNAVYFDEDCFIRGTEGRFQIDSLAPSAGTAVVIGRTAEGALTHTNFEPDTLKARIKFL